MSNKKWFLGAILLFIGGLVLGLATAADAVNFLSKDIEALKELAGFLAPLPRSSVLVFIFLKNISALMISFVLSPVFLLMPIMALTLNGWVLGLVSVIVVQEQSLGYLLAGVLPHGIFEIPAFIIGEVGALSFGAAVILAVFKKEKRSLLLPHLRQS